MPQLSGYGSEGFNKAIGRQNEPDDGQAAGGGRFNETRDRQGQGAGMGVGSAARLIQGNEAAVQGALAAGLSFFAGYPITPANEVSELLSVELPKAGGVFMQMEDEIGSIAAVIGASIGGLKSATATSGPGFSLMQENIGFACMSEIPCVIINSQRAGPSTGLPTAPAQGDVMQARWGTHGDHPIIVLAPSSVQETYELAIRAFNLAEKYRTPVILLLDEVLSHMREVVDLSPPEPGSILQRQRPSGGHEEYLPYANTAEVPSFAPFGEGYRYNITGLYHDSRGFPTERPDEIGAWVERTFAKIENHLDDIITYREEQVQDADVVVVSFGISARSARHAMKLARQAGRKVGLVTLHTIWPFPEALVRRLASQVTKLVVPELNRGQLALEVERVVQGQCSVVRVNRYDGLMITPEAVLKAL
ncbi:MAG TPA: 2-oxoacid:acceptor oxidoreductase subunit alpha [Dehalococcoidia bacterium]|nr:2-oxoacid:acceptor oxidoreductase subunit alpha [Dehalococcoidia bacterium]